MDTYDRCNNLEKKILPIVLPSMVEAEKFSDHPYIYIYIYIYRIIIIVIIIFIITIFTQNLSRTNQTFSQNSLLCL